MRAGSSVVRIFSLSLEVVLGERARDGGLRLAGLTLSGALLVGAVLRGVPGGSFRMGRAVGWRVARPFVRVPRVLRDVIPGFSPCVRGAGGVVSLALRPGVGGPEGLPGGSSRNGCRRRRGVRSRRGGRRGMGKLGSRFMALVGMGPGPLGGEPQREKAGKKNRRQTWNQALVLFSFSRSDLLHGLLAPWLSGCRRGHAA